MQPWHMLTIFSKSLQKSFSTHANEHYPSSSIGVYPFDNDSSIAIVLVANKYSLNNFWSGRWRSLYIFNPSGGSLSGSIKVDVHYFEDGNVRMLTTKPVSASVSSSSASDIVRQIAQTERKYQEDLNRAFTNLNEGAFKGLRRQLPVTRQKVEWEKISGYRVSSGASHFYELSALTNHRLVRTLEAEDRGSELDWCANEEEFLSPCEKRDNSVHHRAHGNMPCK